MSEQRKTPAQKATGAENSSMNIVPQGQAAATGIVPGAYLDCVEDALRAVAKTGTAPNFEDLIRLALEYGDKGEQGADMLANYLAQVESGGSGKKPRKSVYNTIRKGLGRIRVDLGKSSQELPIWKTDPDPWPEPVAMIDVVRELEALMRSVIYAPEEQCAAFAYFTLSTWFVDYCDFVPYGLITSAAPQCGKTILLTLFSKVVARPYLRGKPTAAQVYRAMNDAHPTFLLDEVDTYLKKDEEMQGILNTGNTRETAIVSRCAPNTLELEDFNCFGVKIFSGIRSEDVGAAFSDRCIIFRLQKKGRGEKRQRVRDIAPAKLETLRRKMARLAEDYGERLRADREELPFPDDVFSDRDCDKWETLFRLARFVGEGEMRRLIKAALVLNGEKGEPTLEMRMLSDVREIIQKCRQGEQNGYTLDNSCETNPRVSIANDARLGDFITAEDIAKALNNNREWDWHTWNRGNGLTVEKVGRVLSPFSKSVKIRALNNKRAYVLDGECGLMQAFACYLPPPDTDAPEETGADGTAPFDSSEKNQSGTRE